MASLPQGLLRVCMWEIMILLMEFWLQSLLTSLDTSKEGRSHFQTERQICVIPVRMAFLYVLIGVIIQGRQK